MADPKRLAAQKALTTLLAAIHPDDGYTYNLAGAVFRGRVWFGEAEPLPMLAILEPADAQESIPTDNPAAKRAGPYELLVQGFVEDDEENPTDPALLLAADVTRALAIEREKGGSALLGGVCHGLRISPAVVRPPDELSSKAYFWMRVSLDIVEDLKNPFA